MAWTKLNYGIELNLNSGQPKQKKENVYNFIEFSIRIDYSKPLVATTRTSDLLHTKEPTKESNITQRDESISFAMIRLEIMPQSLM